MWKMFIKQRTESVELQIFNLLDKRMKLNEKDKQYYLSLKKGFEGEILFDSFLADLQYECLILCDLLLQVNNTVFQIDTLVIIGDSIYVFEVKNFEGDYLYDSDHDKFYLRPRTEISNPYNQLRRTESLLRQLLQSHGFNINIEAAVVFVNPEFTLYQAPTNRPFIFPSQINRYLRKLSANPSRLQRKHKLLAEKLMDQHLEESPYSQVPAYKYEQLRKGITCGGCGAFGVGVEGTKIICSKCGYWEKTETALLRSIEEFILLFPKEKITTKIIQNWCNEVVSLRSFQRILEKYFKKIGSRRGAYYE